MKNKRKLVFYGAISVDGQLARENHSLDWLFGTEGEGEIGYLAFYETVDTVLMGRKTYDQILAESRKEFPYAGKECYVFSRTSSGSNEYVDFVNDDIAAFTRSLKMKEGKRIWIVGGGEVLQPLLDASLVDEWIIQISPTILGRGIPLFKPVDQENELKLVDVRRIKQFAELHYVRKLGSDSGH